MSENIDIVGKKSSHTTEMQAKISTELKNIEKNIEEMDNLKKSSIEKLENQKKELKKSTAKSVCDEHYETLREIAAAGKTIQERKISITKLDETIAGLDEQIAKIQAEHDKVVGELELKRRKLGEYLKHYDELNDRLENLLKKLGEEEAKHCQQLNNLRAQRSELLKQKDLSPAQLETKLNELDAHIANLNQEHETLIDTISKHLSDIAMAPDIAVDVEELLSKPEAQEQDEATKKASVDTTKGKKSVVLQDKAPVGTTKEKAASVTTKKKESVVATIAEEQEQDVAKGKASVVATKERESVLLVEHITPNGTQIEVRQSASGNIIESHRSLDGKLTEERRSSSGTILEKLHEVTEEEQKQRRSTKEIQEHEGDTIVFENQAQGTSVSITIDTDNQRLSLSLNGAPESVDVQLIVDKNGRMTVDKGELEKLKAAGLLDDPAVLALLESDELNLSELLSEKEIQELQTFEETLQKEKTKSRQLSKKERQHLLSQCLQITPSDRIITQDDKILNLEDARELGLLSEYRYGGEDDYSSQDQYDIISEKEDEGDEECKYKKKLTDADLYYDLDSGSSPYSSEKGSMISVLSSQECDYLKQIFGKSLSLALAEIVAVQPTDPIHYLGHWFLKYRYNQEIDEVRRLEIQNLLMEQERIEADRWHAELQEEARLAILEALFRAENIIIQHDFDRTEMLEEELEGEFGGEGLLAQSLNIF